MPTATAFDFSTVSVETATLPKNGAGRPRARKDNPFTEVLAKSYEAFQADGEAGRSITVPGKNAAEAVYLIRQAADDLGIGSRIHTLHKGEAVALKDCKDIRGNVTVLFAGKNRKQKPAANADGESAESASAE